MHKNRFRGFTLIELLVVIAIIGILSAVILASLNTARQKGSDAAVQSDMASIQTEAEIYYGGGDGNTGTNTYVGVNTADPVITNALTSIKNNDGGTAPTWVVDTNGQYYVVQAPLMVDVGTDGYWCIDNTGAAKGESAALASTATACP